MNKTLFEKAQAFLASDGTEPMIVNDKVAIWADMEPEDGYISIRSWHLDKNMRPDTADKFLTSWDGTQKVSSQISSNNKTLCYWRKNTFNIVRQM